MQIVAVLDVNERFSDEAKQHTLDEVVDRFIGYYERPTENEEAVVVTRGNFYQTFGIKTHTFNFDSLL